MSEVAAAKEWGIVPDPDGELPENWFLLPRKARAIMVAYTQLSGLSAALIAFDAKGYWEKYWADVKPPRRGGR